MCIYVAIYIYENPHFASGSTLSQHIYTHSFNYIILSLLYINCDPSLVTLMKPKASFNQFRHCFAIIRMRILQRDFLSREKKKIMLSGRYILIKLRMQENYNCLIFILIKMHFADLTNFHGIILFIIQSNIIILKER